MPESAYHIPLPPHCLSLFSAMATAPSSPFRFRTLTLNPEPKPAFAAPTRNLFFSHCRKCSVRSQSHSQSQLDLSSEIAAGLHLDQPMQAFNPLEPVPEAVVGPSVAFVPRPKRARKNVLLFYCEEMSDLARRVVAESDAIELRSISWK